jgi:hypothetical protein
MRNVLKIMGVLIGITNLLFAISFAKIYGGRYGDYAFSIQQTNDGGYIVAGWTGSFGAGDDDFLIIKLDSNGNIEWAKTFGVGWGEVANSIQQASDGGYIVAGTRGSFGVGCDFLVIKTQDGSMAPNCPWYDCSPTVTSPNLSMDFPSINITSPNLTITSPQFQLLHQQF